MRKFKGSSDFLANASPTILVPVRQADSLGRSTQDVGTGGQASAEYEGSFSSDIVMAALDELKSATPGILAQLLKADAGNVSSFLAELASQKFVEETPPQKRGDEPEFSLTGVGKRLLRYRKMAKI